MLVGLGVVVGLGVPPVMVIGDGEPGNCELGGCELGGSDDAGGGDTNGGMPSLSSILTSAPA